MSRFGWRGAIRTATRFRPDGRMEILCGDVLRTLMDTLGADVIAELEKNVSHAFQECTCGSRRNRPLCPLRARTVIPFYPFVIGCLTVRGRTVIPFYPFVIGGLTVRGRTVIPFYPFVIGGFTGLSLQRAGWIDPLLPLIEAHRAGLVEGQSSPVFRVALIHAGQRCFYCGNKTPSPSRLRPRWQNVFAFHDVRRVRLFDGFIRARRIDFPATGG